MKKLHATVILFLTAAALTAMSPAKQRGLTAGFTGDIIMHENIKKFAELKNMDSVNNFGYDYFFERISPRLAYPDIMCANMEFPIRPPYKSEGFIFNSPPMIIDALMKSGIDILNLANNHITDQYTDGVVHTARLLDSRKIDYIGSTLDETRSRKGIVREINGIRIGFLAYTGLINYADRRESKNYYINWIYEKDKLASDIASMKSRCDFTVIQIHDGVEYTLSPAEWKVELYRETADMGADLIIGHHPHTIQSAEIYKTSDGRNVPIFYSLGNFLADQVRSLPVENSTDRISIKSSFIVYLHLFKKRSMVLHEIEVYPVFTENTTEIYNGTQYRNIQVIPLPDEIQKLEKLLTDGEADITEIKKLKYLETQVRMIKKVVFPGGVPEEIRFIE